MLPIQNPFKSYRTVDELNELPLFMHSVMPTYSLEEDAFSQLEEFDKCPEINEVMPCDKPIAAIEFISSEMRETGYPNGLNQLLDDNDDLQPADFPSDDSMDELFDSDSQDDIEIVSSTQSSSQIELCVRDDNNSDPGSNAGRSREWMIHSIEFIFLKLLGDMAAGRQPTLRVVPFRRSEFTVFDFQQQINTLKMTDSAYRIISAFSGRDNKAFAVFIRILDICHELLTTNIIATKRDIYYRDAKLFGCQQIVDQTIDSIACMLGVSRSSLNVTASCKGLVVGAIKIWRSNGEIIDCRVADGASDQGLLVPSAESIVGLDISAASFVLVVEKEAVFRLLISDKFCESQDSSVLITGKGYPDIATRQFIKMIADTNRTIPIFALVDDDPYGIDILCTYKFGSTMMSFDNGNLAIPSMKWLGLHYSDWKSHCIDLNMLLPLSKYDRQKGYNLLNKPYLRSLPAWRMELCRLLFTGKKAEIEILYATETVGFSSYLRHKLDTPEEWM